MRIRMIRHAALMLAMAFVAAAVHAQAKIDLNGTWVFAVETDQGSGTARRLCTLSPAGAGVVIDVVGARRSRVGASAGAAPSASTPITAAPAAPPPRATSETRRGRGSGSEAR